VPPPTGKPDPLIGKTLADRYRIDALLGEGGMGKVYAAEHVLMKKRLALKVLHRELCAVPDVVARFEREARAAANIEHPNIAAATDFGKLPEGDVYLALEYVQGRSLRDVIALEAPLAAPRALKIARQIASALASAHALSIVHRDLKPENVMLVKKGGDPDFVKVLDFGIAKVPVEVSGEDGSRPITKMSMILGTPEYMAPEQAMSDAVDGRADVFALGVMLYEMLAGVRPYVKKTDEGILAQQLKGGPPPFATRVPHVSVPPQVETVALQMLSTKREGRCSATEVVAMVDTLLVQPIGQNGQMFTQIGGTVPAASSWPDIPADLAVRAMTSQPDLVPLIRNAEAPAGSVPDVPRGAFGSAPGLGSIPDTEMPRWPGTSAAADSASGATTRALAADTTAPQSAMAGAALQGGPPDPRASQVSVAQLDRAPLIPGLGRPWPKPVLQAFEWVEARKPGLPEPLRSIPAPAFVAAGAILLATVALTSVALVLSVTAGSSQTAAEPGASAAPLASDSKAGPTVVPAAGPRSDQVESTPGAADPVSALRELVDQQPKSAQARLELAKAHRANEQYREAVEAAAKAIELDPKLRLEGEVATLLWATAQHADSRDAAFALLEGPMGDKGADIIYDLSVGKRVGARTKQRAREFLSSERIQSQASPALRIVLELQSARTCRTVHALLPRAQKDGDERALRYLRAYLSRRGCGRRRSHDCYPCLRADRQLTDAISAIEKRSKG